jgi:hypothetical protein
MCGALCTGSAAVGGRSPQAVSSHAATSSASVTVRHPVLVMYVVSSTSVPGRYRRVTGKELSVGDNAKLPASRSRIAPNMLVESIRGAHSHSTAPREETSAVVSPSASSA